ncbi:L-lysine 6-transaminase [Mucilaginibacter aquatilis]|uniref:L-lysine-epsilon aminotransferase n=1 Tax=Mucilaginibacter aquatilis TaxID=1517760 RepID=A0A6I4I6W2_9SPHI|nr:L-lysine 6-transaminase [Mucilaginibacter aquatilis]MVN89868.1 L-lysine 6-transaminase [Mucilaginibacter aquatilis]
MPINPKNVQQILEKHLIADGFDLTFDMERSKGVFIYDSKNDRTLLDFFTCFASVPLGYNHPAMLNDEAFKKDLMLAALSNPSNSDIYTTQYAQFVETFDRVGIPNYLPHAFFVAGGAPAIENALKTAMDWKVQKNFKKGHTTEKGHKVLHFEKAFHGRLGYTLSLTNTLPVKTKWYAKFDWPRVTHPTVQYPQTEANHEDLLKREAESIAQIKQAFIDHKDDICAIIIEPVQAEGGDNHIRPEFARELRILADENEAMLIYDEIQVGVGLSGKFWCHEHFGEEARPDIIAFGKKMQVCGMLAGKRVEENEENVFNVSSRINSTWGGNLVDMVRSGKILEIIEQDNLCDKAATTGHYLQQALHKVAAEYPIISNIRGRGLLTAFDFEDRATRDKFIAGGITHNAMFLGCAEKTIRFRPALTIEPEHIDLGINIMEDIFKQL